MVNPRWRPVFFSALVVIVIWALAITGFNVARNSTITAEKVRAYTESVDLRNLPSAQREEAVQKLANKLNSLSLDERRRAQLERVSQGWFEQMTEEERTKFIEETMPSGFKQMLAAFEQLPEEQRRRTIEDTMRRLKESRAKLLGSEAGQGGTNSFPRMSQDFQGKIRTLGLAAFYSQSSTETKAELAPVLEELQRAMESGRPFRGR